MEREFLDLTPIKVPSVTRVSVGITGKLWRKVTQDEANEWLAMHSNGMGVRAIARTVNRGHRVISSWLMKLGVTSEQIYLTKRTKPLTARKAKARKDTYRFKLEHRLSSLLQMARTRAEKRGTLIELDVPYVKSLYEKQDGRCALTGIQFDLGPATGCRSNPFMMSIDRIDSSLGYTKANVRLVLWAINLAFNEWGEDVYKKVATAYFERQAS